MEKSKMTKKEWFAILRAMVDASTLEDKQGAYDFIDHEVELLSKKASKSAQTKTQKENVGVKAEILEVLTDLGKGVTVTELTVAMDNKYSNQKLSAMLKQMYEVDKTVDKSTEGKKSYFSAM